MAFTLPEVLAALSILGVGLVALTSAATNITRVAGDGWRMRAAATIASSRIEQLASATCATVSSGAASARGIDERWTVQPLGSDDSLRAHRVDLTVAFRRRVARAPSDAREHVYTAGFLCQ